MNKLESHIVILEHFLVESYNMIQFMDGCLGDPKRYGYKYPEQTQTLLENIKDLVDIGTTCVHSGYVVNCKSCQDRVKRYTKLQEARSTFGVRRK